MSDKEGDLHRASGLAAREPVSVAKTNLRLKRRPSRRRLGEILLRSDVVTESDLSAALRRQRETRARIGDILVSGIGVKRQAVAAAAATQIGVEFADLRGHASDDDLANPEQLGAYLAEGIFPVGRRGNGVVYASVDPRRLRSGAIDLGSGSRVVMAEERALRQRIISSLPNEIAARASTRREGARSHRRGAARWQKSSLLACLALFFSLAIAAPYAAVALLIWIAIAIMAANGGIWACALVWGARASKTHTAAPPASAPRLADFRAMPKVSILAPLYREPEMAEHLIEGLSALDYPPELLDIKILLETGDEETRAAIEAASPPSHFEVLVAPRGEPQTKPRALNFAMDFVEGEIIGIYDAEDRPARDQIRRIVEQFAAEPSSVACIQARLGYYNAEENWMTRCFEVEYASWFDVMLPGLRRLGMPLPLGGTSLFIRKGALEAVGGWDSHNVTEDADLGMALARCGLETALSDSMTLEEASCRAGQWIRQRSRWLKGYLATWTTHMRDPIGLWRDLGARRFIGLNVILLSAVLGYLMMPVVWALTFARPLLGPEVGDALTRLSLVTTATLPVIALVAVIALGRRGERRILPVILTAPVYWLLGAIAAYLAIWELFTAPARWRKTAHGRSTYMKERASVGATAPDA